MYTKFFPNRLDGFPFALRDLIAVCTWAETKSVRMHVTWHTHINGVIEIFPWESPWPRWCMWQSPDGRLQLDDLVMSEFALPYPTVAMALRFIESKL